MTVAAAAPLQVGLLGPLRVVRAGSEINPGPPRQRALLAILALRVGEAVGLDEIVDALWGDSPPASVEGSVYTYVSGLRRLLDAGRRTVRSPAQGDTRDEVLGTVARGYVLRVDPRVIDVVTFDRLRSEAAERMAANDLPGAMTCLADSLALWRGQALAGVPGPYAAGQRVRLEELRIGVLEQRAQVQLALDEPRDAAAELTGLIAQFPLRESMHGLLMLALYRSGRPADALQVYRSARERLTTELGIEPGLELQRLQQQVLNNDPSLASRTSMQWPSVVDPASTTLPSGRADPTTIPTTVRTVVAQLPHNVAAFTGRTHELAQLGALVNATSRGDDQGRRNGSRLEGQGTAEQTVLITAIDGCAGVGKTALALRFAHDVASRFPDGQLYVDLRGFDPELPPLSPPRALAQLLRGLGAEQSQLSNDPEVLAAQYRTLLARRRVLVLLDNAASTDQVRHLLPGTPGCLAVVTSRNRLGGLVARHGAHRLTLDVLDRAEATQLLRRLLGSSRVDEHPDAVAELVDLCGGFPLALRLAAERLLASHFEPISQLVDELRDEHDRLDLLGVDDDPAAAVRSVFSWSYHALKPESARLFRLLSLHPGNEFSAAAAYALAGQPIADARKVLQNLTDGHLIEMIGSQRYRQHDLLRLYAGELLEAQESAEDRDKALARVLAFYLQTMGNAGAVIEPGALRSVFAEPVEGCGALEFSDVESALEWIDREQGNLPVAVRYAYRAGHHRACWQLAESLRLVYKLRLTTQEYLEMTTLGLEAARVSGDRRGEAQMLGRRMIGLADRGDAADALELAEELQILAEELGDTNSLGRAVNGMGVVYRRALGQPEEALSHFLRAADLFDLQPPGRRSNFGIVLGNVARVLGDLGRYDEAIRYVDQASAVFQDLDSIHLLGAQLCRAHIEVTAGRPERALPLLDEVFDKRSVLGTR